MERRTWKEEDDDDDIPRESQIAFKSNECERELWERDQDVLKTDINKRYPNGCDQYRLRFRMMTFSSSRKYFVWQRGVITKQSIWFRRKIIPFTKQKLQQHIINSNGKDFFGESIHKGREIRGKERGLCFNLILTCKANLEKHNNGWLKKHPMDCYYKFRSKNYKSLALSRSDREITTKEIVHIIDMIKYVELKGSVL